MSNAFPIFSLLKTPRYGVIFMLVFGLIFYANYYLMANLPGERDFMCVMGAGFTPFNVMFAVFMSLVAGLIVIGIVENSRMKTTLSGVKSGSTSVLAVGLGTLTSFCTFCSLPALTLFGSSISLSFFSDYDSYIKVASTILLFLGFYLVNKELREGCKRCVA